MSVFLNWRRIGRSTYDMATVEARAHYEKDLVYRRWATLHGGVYVPPTDTTPPNPYLSHIPDRDVVTTSGKALTLINPAYMTRQVHALGREQYGGKGHITSLRPLRPGNAPDPWEAQSLKAFEGGVREVVALVRHEGEPYLRFMRPMVTEAGCLKCHAHQGYRLGDVRGGISVSIPYSPYVRAAAQARLPLLLGHAAAALLGLVGVAYGSALLRRRERALVESEARFRALVEQAGDGFELLDLEGRFLDANAAACRMLGYAREELLGLRVTQLDPDLDWAGFLARCGPGASASVATRRRRKDGTRLDLDLTATRMLLDAQPRILVIARDTSERQRTLEALRASEHFLQESQEVGGIGSYDLDIQAGRWTCTSTLEAIFGIDPDYDRSVQGWLRLVHPEDAAAMGAYFQEQVLGQRQPFDREYRIRRGGDQETRWVHGRGRLQFDAAGTPLRMLGTIQDITGRRAAEEERERLQAQLAQAQRLESIGSLAGGVAHDFNNMMAVVQGQVQLALPALPPDSPLREHLEHIRTAARTATDLTRQLLAFARLQTVAPRVLDLNAAIGDMLKLLGRILGENIEIAWEPGEALWPVKMDPAQLDQILANLLVNARDAIPGEGRVILSTSNRTIEPACRALHGDAEPGDYVMLAVSDSGCGMDRATQARIFEPFYTTKPMGQGTGLGLATVWGIVKQNGGSISVYSEPGFGTTFRIYLPRCHEAATPAPQAPVEQPAGGGETLLLVEDEPLLLLTSQVLLQQLGYRVLTAASPREALEILEAHPEGIHLLITDVVMPGMSGRDLAERVQQRHPELKCIFVSGYAADVIAHQGILEPDVLFLAKPFSIQELAAMVRRALTPD